MTSSTAFRKCTFVIDKSEMPALSDAVLHSTIDVEWKDLGGIGNIIMYCDDTPLIVFHKKATKGEKEAENNDWIKLAYRSVLLVEDSKHGLWKCKNVSKLFESHVCTTTILTTASVWDTVKLLAYIGTKVEDEINTLKCAPNQFWQSAVFDDFKKCQSRTCAVACILQVPCFTPKCANCILNVFPNVADIVMYYKENPAAGRGDEHAEDFIARIKVNNRCIGEIDSQALRSALFGMKDEDFDYV